MEFPLNRITHTPISLFLDQHIYEIGGIVRGWLSRRLAINNNFGSAATTCRLRKLELFVAKLRYRNPPTMKTKVLLQREQSRQDGGLNDKLRSTGKISRTSYIFAVRDSRDYDSPMMNGAVRRISCAKIALTLEYGLPVISAVGHFQGKSNLISLFWWSSFLHIWLVLFAIRKVRLKLFEILQKFRAWILLYN